MQFFIFTFLHILLFSEMPNKNVDLQRLLKAQFHSHFLFIIAPVYVPSPVFQMRYWQKNSL